MLLHLVLALLALGFRSAEAVSFNQKASLCNVACGQQGLWNMPSKGATAKANKCYHCWATGYGENCPNANYRDDGWTYDNCCNLYDCSCTSASPCTQSQVGDGSCQGECNNAQCGYDNGDCSVGSSPSPPPTHCPCCSQHTPTLAETTGARTEEGFCWHCYQTDYGGNCPDADKRSDGWTHDDCCDKYAKTTRVCTQRYSEAECIDHHGANTDGLLDAALDAGAGLVDAAGNAVSAAFTAANPLSDLEPIEPDCVLKLDNCGASCTFGFSSVKSSLLVEFVLELDVQSATQGTATFEASANGAPVIKNSHDFSDGAFDAYCMAIPGLGVAGLGGLSLCMNLDPDQTGGFTITSEVFMELFVRISLLGFDDTDFALGNDRVSWPCPNIPLIVGCFLGAVVLCGLLCFVGYRRRKARLPSNAQASVEMPDASGQEAGATPTSPTVGVAVSVSHDAGKM